MRRLVVLSVFALALVVSSAPAEGIGPGRNGAIAPGVRAPWSRSGDSDPAWQPLPPRR